jgi:formylglycine-generating enzyme required for sulfatase activity
MQWEFAARGGLSELYYGYSSAGDVAWYRSNAGSNPMEVGRKKPNAFGLYDMIGNIVEWCRDWYDGALPTDTEQTFVDYPGATEAESRAVPGATNPQRVSRGGYFDTASSSPPNLYTRAYKKINETNQYYGLRLWAMER